MITTTPYSLSEPATREPVTREAGITALSEPAAEEIPSIHRKIMRKLCLGETLESISATDGLRMDQLKQVVESPLFKRGLAAMQAEIDAKLAADLARKQSTEQVALVDQLRNMLPRALNTIEGELANFDPVSGATASTRLKAAELVINMEGSLSPERHRKVQQGTIIQLNFSASKLGFLQKRVKDGAISLPEEREEADKQSRLATGLYSPTVPSPTPVTTEAASA